MKIRPGRLILWGSAALLLAAARCGRSGRSPSRWISPVCSAGTFA